MSQSVHEHFCRVCYPHLKTNGTARGWYRCTRTKCTKPMTAPCPKHEKADTGAEREP